MFKKVIEKFRQQQTAAAAAPDIEEPPPPPPRGLSGHIELILAFCLAFAAQPTQPTTSYHEVGLGLMMCSFACLFMSMHKCFGPRTCRRMQQVGLFFGVTSFFMGTTYQCSVWLRCVGWAVYALTWLAIFVFSLNIITPLA